MPAIFPVYDAETGALVDVEHYSLTEVAEILHVSRSTAYKAMADEQWPHMVVMNRAYLSRADIAAVVAGLRRNDDAVRVPDADPEEPATLGEPMPPDAWTGADGGSVR